MAETALMAANKYRLRHLAKRGNRGAITTLWLLDRTDKLLSLVLIANTLINAMATALVTAIAILFFGHEESVITIATAVVAFLLIVFAEIAPKIIGKLQEGAFIKAFRDKGRFSSLMEEIPVHVVMNSKAGLIGAAEEAKRMLVALSAGSEGASRFSEFNGLLPGRSVFSSKRTL